VPDELARDLVVLTANGAFSEFEVLSGYGLLDLESDLTDRHNEIATIISTLLAYQPFYQSFIKWQERIKTDDKAVIREQARLIYAANLRNLHMKMQNPKTSAQALAVVMNTLAEVGDLKPKKEDNVSGLTVMIDFGQNVNATLPESIRPTPTHPTRPIIEHNDS